MNEIKIFAGLHHSHLLGVGMKTRHFRNGTELSPLMFDPDYDFNFQEMRQLPKERAIKPVSFGFVFRFIMCSVSNISTHTRGIVK